MNAKTSTVARDIVLDGQLVAEPPFGVTALQEMIAVLANMPAAETITEIAALEAATAARQKVFSFSSDNRFEGDWTWPRTSTQLDILTEAGLSRAIRVLGGYRIETLIVGADTLRDGKQLRHPRGMRDLILRLREHELIDHETKIQLRATHQQRTEPLDQDPILRLVEWLMMLGYRHITLIEAIVSIRIKTFP